MRDYRKESMAAKAKAEEPVVEPEEVEEVVEQQVEETVGPEEVKEPEPVYGVVHGCSKLRVRTMPGTDAGVACELDEGSEVMIEDESDAEFYKVCTEAGITGYCMKKYIAVLV